MRDIKKINSDGLLLCELQAKAFENSIDKMESSSEIFIRRFMKSKIAKKLDNQSILDSNIQANDILTLVDEEYGATDYGSVKYTHNEMYWIGYIYRYWHYYTEESSKVIYKQAPVETMKRNYLIFHTMASEVAIEDLKEIYRQKKN